MKKAGVFVLIIILVSTCTLIYISKSTEELRESIDKGTIIWSSSDFNSNKSIVSMKTSDVVSNISRTYVYDYLNDDEFENLTYPYYYNDIKYYTTNSKTSNYVYIITKDYDRINIIYEKETPITYKKIYESDMFFLSNGSIYKLNLETKEEKILYDDVNIECGFDINDNGDILFIKESTSEITILDAQSKLSTICTGVAAQFIENDSIVYSNKKAIIARDLATNREKTLKRRVNCSYIMLSPNKKIIYYITLKTDFIDPWQIPYENLNYMLIDGSYSRKVSSFHLKTNGIECTNDLTDYYDVGHKRKTYIDES